MSVKLTDEELQKVKEFSDKYFANTQKYGELHYQRKLLNNEIELVEKDMELIDDERKQLTSQLSAKYGIGSVDLTTGIFNPE